MQSSTADILNRACADDLSAAQVTAGPEVFWELQNVAAVYPREDLSRSLQVSAEMLTGRAGEADVVVLAVVYAVEVDRYLPPHNLRH